MKPFASWRGGLRGALCLALALVLPPSLAFRNEIVIAAFGVVAVSVVLMAVTRRRKVNLRRR
jgi:monovalent cation:H+ antiporter, CPA1 family